ARPRVKEQSQIKRKRLEVERRHTDLWTRFIHLLQKDPILSAETPKSLSDLKDISACAAGKPPSRVPTATAAQLYPHPNKSPGSYRGDKGAPRRRSKSNNGEKSEHDTGTEAKSQKLTLLQREGWDCECQGVVRVCVRLCVSQLVIVSFDKARLQEYKGTSHRKPVTVCWRTLAHTGLGLGIKKRF
ncbi:hypothetical protein QQF64_035595, partial [Cirrhinus molitorella]